MARASCVCQSKKQPHVIDKKPANQKFAKTRQSVALQEAALAHIMNAEGEKMQAIIGMDNITSGDLLTLNKSVESMINAITRLEMMLQAKLELVTGEMAV
jgi:hypothetical protein